MSKEGGGIYSFPNQTPRPANDNVEKDTTPSLEIDGMIVGELQLIFNKHREDNPYLWKESKLDEVRKLLQVVADITFAKKIRESSPQERNDDPRYFYVALERLQATHPQGVEE